MIAKNELVAFRNTLFTGGYNLLLGSGISLDSQNGLHESLRSAEDLRKHLCVLKNVKENTVLQRVSALLSSNEVQEHLVKPYSKCKPGPSLSNLPFFLWKRLFTFNIDDVLENLFQGTIHKKQELVPINFNSPFEPSPSQKELQSIHLHGWVGDPVSQFVFSHADYAKSLNASNPWTRMLAEILPTEPFIIAGTSLNEVDLEFYLSNRTPTTPRRNKGPSLLIEPYPDKATEADCSRHGLILVKSTFGEFLEWLKREFPSPPTLSQLIVPDIATLFPKTAALDLMSFFTDFKLVKAGEKPRSSVPSPFLYGREPSQDDLDEHLDIDREDNDSVVSDVEEILSYKDKPTASKIVMLLNEAGSGKTTVLSRVACELVRAGHIVVSVQTLSRIDVKNAIECFVLSTSPVIVVVDRFADYVGQIVDILKDKRTLGKVFFLAAERTYRREYIDLVLGDTPFINRTFFPLAEIERQSLIELYRHYGLVGTAEAVHNPKAFAQKLEGDLIAIAVCRILNDFRPLEKIVDSLWEATPAAFRLPYLCAALAMHCHPIGLRYSILQKIAGSKTALSDFFSSTLPLSLIENSESDEFVVPINAIYAERILQRAILKDRKSLFEAFVAIASGLAPYVNRTAVKMRTPDARLAGRLLDADKIAKPMLGSLANELYETCKREWEWNSRYWEQRALLVAGEDLKNALQYARHAVAIEVHPYTLTTLGKLLFKQMEALNPQTEKYVFDEAFEKLNKAIEIEGFRSRITIHPYSTLLSGTARFFELGGKLSQAQLQRLNDHMGVADYHFGNDPLIEQFLKRLDRFM